MTLWPPPACKMAAARCRYRTSHPNTPFQTAAPRACFAQRSGTARTISRHRLPLHNLPKVPAPESRVCHVHELHKVCTAAVLASRVELRGIPRGFPRCRRTTAITYKNRAHSMDDDAIHKLIMQACKSRQKMARNAYSAYTTAVAAACVEDGTAPLRTHAAYTRNIITQNTLTHSIRNIVSSSMI